MQNIIKLIIIITILGSISCNKAKKETKNKLTKFSNKTIKLPEELKILYKDSLYSKKLLVPGKPKLIISTFLWGECHSCIADLNKWEEFYEYTVKNEEINLLFFYTYQI